MEIHETHFQAWHRLSITPMFKSGFVLMLTPTLLVQTKGCGSLEAVLPTPLRPPGAHPASFWDNMSSELVNRLDIILCINPGIE